MLTLRKITPHNVFVKWPKIIAKRFREKIRNSRLRMLLFYDRPVILEDDFGIRFVLYPWDHVSLDKLYSRRNYRDEFAALKKLIRPGATVFDVGANIGLHTTLFSRWAEKNGHVYSFEPVPDTFWLLRETLALNRCNNVTAFQTAVLDRPGHQTINLFEQKHSVWNSFGKPNFEGITPQASVEVSVTTIDEFCRSNSIEKIDFLKIDVEGFEKQVFAGAKEMLSTENVGVLSFEISQIPLKGSGTTAEEVFAAIKQLGYKTFRFDPANLKFVSIEGTDQFYENYYASREDLTNV